MSHKNLARIAVVMIVVFGAITLLYPMIFNPDARDKSEVAPPASQPLIPPALPPTTPPAIK